MPFWSDAACLDDGCGTAYSSTDIQRMVDALALRIIALDGKEPLALAGDNSIAWIIGDLAAAHAGRAVVPIPGFFTAQQIAHVCATAGVQHVVVNGDVRTITQVWPESGAGAWADAQRDALCGTRQTRLRETSSHLKQQSPVAALPEGTQKITFTSGTTGQPKGICLTFDQQMATARSLFERLSRLNIRTHLNLLPLAVLLENIAGVYAPLMMGARVVTPSLADTGLKGSSDFDAATCLRAIAHYKAESIILLPQMLHAMVGAMRADASLRECTRSLKFVAVGGAPVPLAVLTAAREMGLPAYEGYGLTECASVCCLNVPGADVPGTVGMPLPGLTVGLTDEGEVWIEGRSHAGVLGLATIPADGDRAAHDEKPSRFMTGDIGQWVEKEGKRFLQIVGRRKHVIITSFGRNVSPEWPERLLMDSGVFRQVVVMGDGQPHLRAVIVPGANADIAAVVDRANRLLPDYAQVRDWCISQQPFTHANGLATANGRPLRQRIEQQFADAFKA